MYIYTIISSHHLNHGVEVNITIISSANGLKKAEDRQLTSELSTTHFVIAFCTKRTIRFNRFNRCGSVTRFGPRHGSSKGLEPTLGCEEIHYLAADFASWKLVHHKVISLLID